MWGGKNKIWQEYNRGIIATDAYTSVFLAAYLKHAVIQRLHTWQMEVVDINKYKVIKKPAKVYRAMREQIGEPFVFVIGKN